MSSISPPSSNIFYNMSITFSWQTHCKKKKKISIWQISLGNIYSKFLLPISRFKSLKALKKSCIKEIALILFNPNFPNRPNHNQLDRCYLERKVCLMKLIYILSNAAQQPPILYLCVCLCVCFLMWTTSPTPRNVLQYL